MTKSKDQVFKAFVQWKARVENQCDRRIKGLIKDNGLEFCHKEVNNLCNEHGIYANFFMAEILCHKEVNIFCH